MRRLIVVGLLSLGIIVGTTGTALATHCYVGSKRNLVVAKRS